MVAYRDTQRRRVVYTAIAGSNADLIRNAFRLHVKPGDRIADVTYGKGVFWSKTDLTQVHLDKSDVATCPEAPYDFTALPYEDAIYDHVVLDPPYQHNPGSPWLEGHYRNAETTQGLYHSDIIDLYRRGMTEAKRVLKLGGLLWVKTQDEVESGRQRWSHIEIYQEAVKLGMEGKDLFVLFGNAYRPIQGLQQHARKNHSYLWLFK